MERRLFLAGLFGVAGATALGAIVKPVEAVAGVPGSAPGILDELDDPVANDIETAPETVEPEQAQYYYRRRRRRRRRRSRRWRTVCRRYWYRGRVRRRCYRRRVSFWIYF